MNDNYWDNMIKEVDKNGDKEIDYQEFIEMMSTIKKKWCWCIILLIHNKN